MPSDWVTKYGVNYRVGFLYTLCPSIENTHEIYEIVEDGRIKICRQNPLTNEREKGSKG